MKPFCHMHRLTSLPDRAIYHCSEPKISLQNSFDKNGKTMCVHGNTQISFYKLPQGVSFELFIWLLRSQIHIMSKMKSPPPHPIFAEIDRFIKLRESLNVHWSNLQRLYNNFLSMQLVYNFVLEKRFDIEEETERKTATDVFIRNYYSLILFLVDEIITVQNGRLIRKYQVNSLPEIYKSKGRMNYFNNFSDENFKSVPLTLLSIDGLAFIRKICLENLMKYKSEVKLL